MISKLSHSLTHLTVALVTLVLMPATAYADQCALVSRQQAVAALNNLRIGQTIYKLCEPCGEKAARPIVIRSLSVNSEPSSDFWSVKVNGEEIDLAYIYIEFSRTGLRQRVNLALTATCPARSISPILLER
jgi:hypothetical protein